MLPLAVAESGLERILFEAFLIFAAAKVAGQVFQWLKQPSIVGELLAGAILGPQLLGWIHLGEFQEALAELGVIFLLFGVGLETRFSELRAVGSSSIAVGVSGIVLPFVLGWLAMVFTGHASAESLFVGTALVATSVGITARVLGDMGRLRDRSSRVILGAAVIDDILGLVLLAVVAGAVAGTISAGRVIATVLIAVGFVAFLAVAGTRLVRRFPHWLDLILPDKSPLAVALMLALGLSALAAQVGLAAIIGAFMAGMMLAEAREQYELEHQLSNVNELLVPFFFVLTGAKVDLGAFTDPSLIALTAMLTVLAVIGKYVAGVLGARSLGKREARIVGVGMVPRGEVGIIVASIGLATGTVGDDIYSVVVAVSIITTLIVPPVLIRLSKPPPASDATSRPAAEPI